MTIYLDHIEMPDGQWRELVPDLEDQPDPSDELDALLCEVDTDAAETLARETVLQYGHLVTLRSAAWWAGRIVHHELTS